MPNKITLSGTVNTNPVFSHETCGEKFYSFSFISERKSGTADLLRCVVPEINAKKIVEDNKIAISGEVRTKNYTDETGKRRVDVYIFVEFISDFEEDSVNNVELEGYIVKDAIYRVTPRGREIADLIVASRRNNVFTKSDYIPCIAWGRNAKRVCEMSVGTKVRIIGRMQSRIYVKNNKDESQKYGVAYELSIGRIYIQEEKEDE